MNTALTTKPNRRIALLIATIMALTLWAGFPLGANAASSATEIDLTDTSKTSGTNWTYNNNVFTINSDADVTITGTTTTSRVEVAASATNVTITLDNASITSTTASPLKLNASSSATIKLQNTNALTATSNIPNAALNAPAGTTLTITSASGDKSTEGTLTAINDTTTDQAEIYSAAGIGGNNGQAGGNITINGGTVNATGGMRAAGIGGGRNGAAGTIKINGGTVTATSASRGAGIGSGGGISGNIGPTEGGTIEINDGTVTATGGSNAAGIGGGLYGSGGNITISGGTVTANAGNGSAAGIGGGYGGSSGGNIGTGGNITINGGTVTAMGTTNGAGIGGGEAGGGGNITINGGAILAIGGANVVADIGGSYSQGTIKITGGTIIAPKNGIPITPTIENHPIILAKSVKDITTNASNGILIGENSVTIDTGKTPKEVTIKTALTVLNGATFTIPEGIKVIVPENVTLTIADGGALDLLGTLEIQQNGTLTVSEKGDFFKETDATYTNNGTGPSTFSGAFVSDIDVTAITNNKITIIKPVQTEHSNATQAVEYAISESDSPPTETQDWTETSTPDTIDISPLDPNKTYYIFARSKAASPYKSGRPKSIEVKTLYPVTVTFNTQDGSDAPQQQTKLSNETVGIVDNPTKTGYAFDGWFSQQDGDGTAYTLGEGGTKLSEATGVNLNNNAGTITLYAKWIEKTGYKVVYDTQGATTGTINNKENVKWTDASLLPGTQVEKTGYTPPQWNVTANGSKAGVLGTDKYSELAASDIPESITLTAQWSPRTDIPLTFNANGGTDGSPTSWSDLTFGQTISAKGKTLPAKDTGAPTRTGYTFSGWSTIEGSSNSADFNESATVDWTSKNVYAVWTAKPVTITYEAAGGSDPNGGTAVGTLGEQIGTLATTSKTGYDFVWKNGGTVYSTETVLSEAAGVVLTDGEGNNTLTLTADWTADPVAITYDLNAGDDETAGLTNTPSDAGTYHSAIAIFPAATRTGYTLEGWYADEDVTDNEYEAGTAISAGVTYDSGYKLKLYAKWSAKSVTVNYQYNYGTAGVYDTASGTYDGKIDAAPTVPIRAGYTFGGWFKDEAVTDAWIFGEEGTALNADNGVENANEATPTLSLYAKWTANPPQTYTVTVNSGTGGGSFAVGAEVSIIADTLSGKIFDSWTGSVDFADANSPATTFIMPANAVTVTATYKDAPVVVPPGSTVEEDGDNIKVTLPDDGGSVIVPPGSAVMPGENENEIEVILPGDGGSVIVPPGSAVTPGENEGEIEVTLPGDGGSVIVPPGSAVMPGENESEIEVILPGDGGSVIVPPGATVDAEGNVTAPPEPPATENGWVKNKDGEWEYLVGGEAKTGWLYDTSYKAWFHFDTNGAMQTGWVYDQSDKAWYYLAGNGKMVAGKWFHDTDGRWYYLSGNGKMLTGKQTIGGKVYSFRGNGVWVN